MEYCQDDESSSEGDRDRGSLENSAVNEEIDGVDDKCSSSIDDNDDARNTLRCESHCPHSYFYLITLSSSTTLYKHNISF